MTLTVGYRASGLPLECTFKVHTSYWGTKYTCVVNDFKTTLNDRFITKINGVHLDGKTNEDVTKVLIDHQDCPYLPLNLGTHFKNLDTLYVMKSKVTHLTNDDLTGLTKLKIFDVSYNPVKRLHRDYFKGHGSIEIISFYDCDLNYIEEGALNPLVNLKEGHFQGNECIDYRGDDVDLLPSLREEIKENCEDPHRKIPGRKETSSSKSADYYDELHDHSWFDSKHWVDSYEHDGLLTKVEHTPTPTTATTFKHAEVKETDLRSDSFVRRNAILIISFLLVIIAAFGFVLYKVNAFNRENWR